jgi:hypothetical protein
MWWLVALLITVLFAPERADARPCEYLPMPCTYQGEAFAVIVVDSETMRPVADVHALAEWQMVGAHGRNGPLMVQDAISGADGVLRFPKWGPLAGPVSGLSIGSDPVVTLFKAGYEPVVENNRLWPPATDTEEIRRFGQDGATIQLVPFRGSAASWVKQLRRLADPQAIPSAPARLRKFRTPYLNRFSRLWAEVEGLPEPLRSEAKDEFAIEYYLRVFEGAQP